MLLLSGCAKYASFNPAFHTKEVGPGPGLTAGLKNEGALVVWSAWVQEADNSGYVIRVPQAYRIIDHTGHREGVTNSDSFNPTRFPETVKLFPGSYTVEAPADTYRAATVPVRIVRGRTTVVNLQKGAFPETTPPAGKRVIAPEGYVVGWAAE